METHHNFHNNTHILVLIVHLLVFRPFKRAVAAF